jgi:SET domain-containing protein
MLLIDTYLDRSPVQGIGVFAKQKVAAGEVVWRLDLNFDRLIAVDVYEAQTGPVKAYLDRYAYPHRADPRFIVFEADDARYMNHADDPNCDVSQVDVVIARRDIAVGEELTCDYNLFFAEAGFEFLGDRHL